VIFLLKPSSKLSLQFFATFTPSHRNSITGISNENFGENICHHSYDHIFDVRGAFCRYQKYWNSLRLELQKACLSGRTAIMDD
jgi:hypothetical protein